ncbi:MAG: MFS transporter [Anaerolineae bacterium]|jgi:MFS family permease|nr:MFS transporter [Anaerolineae bacterium]
MKPNRYWLIVAVTFAALLVSAGIRTAPGVIIRPLEAEFGWDRASISFAVAISLFAFGLGGPLGGTLMDRFGPRRVTLAGTALNAIGLALLIGLRELWQLHLLWGLLVGAGTGAISGVLGATIATRWFNRYRGVILGLFGAASAAGQLIFVPSLILLVNEGGWRSIFGLMGAVAALVLIPVLLFLRDRPEDVGLKPLGTATAASAASDTRRTPLAEAIRTRDFWLLAGSFFICGYTTNGLVGTHLLPHSLEHGFVEAEISWALAVMGVMNIFGTLASGWLSDRYDNRKLLAMYYGFRGLSLAALPFILEMQGMLIFAIIYGLDWVATVPPTVNLTAQRFGRASLGTLYGWIFCSHMIGAGIASYAGGFFRDLLGDYHLIFVSAAILGLVAAGLSLSLSGPRKVRPAVQGGAA